MNQAHSVDRRKFDKNAVAHVAVTNEIPTLAEARKVLRTMMVHASRGGGGGQTRFSNSETLESRCAAHGLHSSCEQPSRRNTNGKCKCACGVTGAVSSAMSAFEAWALVARVMKAG